jgi:hypothetical protein
VRRKGQASLSDVVEILHGIGRMLQEIDAKLFQILELLEEGRG